MKRILKITLSVILWGAIVAYLLWASGLGKRNRAECFVGRVEISVADSCDIAIITSAMVEKWVKDSGLWPVGKNIDQVDTKAVSNSIAGRDFVSTVKTYVDLNGVANIVVTQREPVMRFITASGYNFYYTSDGYVIPVSGRSAHHVPVVTGSFGLPFDRKFSGNLNDYAQKEEKNQNKNYIFTCNLINFVEWVRRSDFWNSQIVQINVLDEAQARSIGEFRGAETYEPQIELIPRVGNHVILLGTVDGYDEKLDRLMYFYTEGLNREGWNNWNHLSLKYGGQVVCSNR